MTDSQEILRETQLLIGRLTYKPNWTIRARLVEEGRSGFSMIQIVVEARVQDVTKRAVHTTIGTARGLPVWMWAASPEHEKLRFVEYIIRDVEQYESEEWFRLDGEPVRIPHAPLTT